MAQSPNEIKFLHFRYTRKRAATNGVVTEIDARGGVTVAYVTVANGVRYATAKCHVKDNFVKAQGRIKAQGRLKSVAQSNVWSGTEQEFVENITSMIQGTGLSLERKFSGKRKRTS